MFLVGRKFQDRARAKINLMGEINQIISGHQKLVSSWDELENAGPGLVTDKCYSNR